MSVMVEIADRLYDYTDEEAAASEIASFQEEKALEDITIIEIWSADNHPLKADLQHRIYTAIDANGTVQRAQASIPGELYLYVQS